MNEGERERVSEALAVASCVGTTLLCDFATFHKKAEELLGRPIFTHQFAEESIVAELRVAGMKRLTAILEEIEEAGK